jgi:threonine synthase
VAESGGAIDIVSDEEILTAQSWLAASEGIFVEPASAAPIAGLLRACSLVDSTHFAASSIPEGSKIVCTVTGYGLKDPEVISCASKFPAAVLPNEYEVLRALERPRS